MEKALLKLNTAWKQGWTGHNGGGSFQQYIPVINVFEMLQNFAEVGSTSKYEVLMLFHDLNVLH